MVTPVIVDTDIGDDVDDALALALAARSPELELVGVTTVFQRAVQRARLARHLLAAYGRGDVPVIAGADRPLLGTLSADWRVNQAGVLGEPASPDRDGPPEANGAEDAVGFIVREGLTRDGLVLMPIGAMTNVALALAIEPRLAERVRVCAMGGAWDRPGAEYNVRCDPEAVAAVLAAGARVDFVGLDVTTRVPMRAEDVAGLLAAAAGPEAVLADFLRAWQGAGGRARRPVLHDPLAVAAVVRPDLLQWREARVAVELASPHVRGQTCTVAGPPNARVAHAVDGAFVPWFADRVVAGRGRPGAALR